MALLTDRSNEATLAIRSHTSLIKSGSQSPLFLTRLSFEIRQRIYSYALSSSCLIGNEKWPVIKPKRLLSLSRIWSWLADAPSAYNRSLAILLVSRMIHSEASQVLHERLFVLITDRWTGRGEPDLVQSIPRRNLEQLSCIILGYSLIYRGQFAWLTTRYGSDPVWRAPQEPDGFCGRLANICHLHKQCVSLLPSLRFVRVIVETDFHDVQNLLACEPDAIHHIERMLTPFAHLRYELLTSGQQIPVIPLRRSVVDSAYHDATGHRNAPASKIDWLRLPHELRQIILTYTLEPIARNRCNPITTEEMDQAETSYHNSLCDCRDAESESTDPDASSDSSFRAALCGEGCTNPHEAKDWLVRRCDTLQTRAKAIHPGSVEIRRQS